MAEAWNAPERSENKDERGQQGLQRERPTGSTKAWNRQAKCVVWFGFLRDLTPGSNKLGGEPVRSWSVRWLLIKARWETNEAGRGRLALGLESSVLIQEIFETQNWMELVFVQSFRGQLKWPTASAYDVLDPLRMSPLTPVAILWGSAFSSHRSSEGSGALVSRPQIHAKWQGWESGPGQPDSTKP